MGEGETDWIPETPREAARHPDIKLYETITNRFPGDREYRVIIDTIQHLREQHPDLQTYLVPFWTAWSTRKTKSGQLYKPSSLVWLCEWAMQGSIPSANGHEPKPGESVTTQSAIDEVIKNAKQKSRRTRS